MAASDDITPAGPGRTPQSYQQPLSPCNSLCLSTEMPAPLLTVIK